MKLIESLNGVKNLEQTILTWKWLWRFKAVPVLTLAAVATKEVRKEIKNVWDYQMKQYSF